MKQDEDNRCMIDPHSDEYNRDTTTEQEKFMYMDCTEGDEDPT